MLQPQVAASARVYRPIIRSIICLTLQGRCHTVQFVVQLVSQGALSHTSRTKHCTSVHTWQRARVTAQQSERLLEIVADVFYFLRRFPQRFRPLQGMSHCAMFRATCLEMVLRDKLQETLQSDSAFSIRKKRRYIEIYAIVLELWL